MHQTAKLTGFAGAWVSANLLLTWWEKEITKHMDVQCIMITCQMEAWAKQEHPQFSPGSYFDDTLVKEWKTHKIHLYNLHVRSLLQNEEYFHSNANQCAVTWLRRSWIRMRMWQQQWRTRAAFSMGDGRSNWTIWMPPKCTQNSKAHCHKLLCTFVGPIWANLLKLLMSPFHLVHTNPAFFVLPNNART